VAGVIVLGVLVSGSGTNLQAILDAIRGQRLDARVAVVVSNVAGARALERAREAGVEAVVLDHNDFASRTDFDAAVVASVASPVDAGLASGFGVGSRSSSVAIVAISSRVAPK